MPRNRRISGRRKRGLTFVAALSIVACSGNWAWSQTRPISGNLPEVFVHAPNAPAYDNQRDRISQYIISDPHVTGAQLVVPWSAVDQGNGKYDWDFVERAMAPWVKAGKVAGLSFYGAELRTTWNFDGVPATPKYVLDQVDSIRCNVSGQPYLPNVPVYFEAPFVGNYKKLISAAVRHYEGDARVSYIRFGLGAGDESFPASNLDKDPDCAAAWTKHGLTYDQWLSYSVDLIDHLGGLKPKTRIFVPFNNVGSLDRRQIGGDNEFAKRIAGEAAKYGFTIGNEGFGLNYKFNELYKQFVSKTPLYMQTGSVARINDNDRFPSILATARSLQIKTFELYVAAWLIASDPRHPLHQKYGPTYRAGLDSLAVP
jgi:hypothetical protein